MTARPPDGFAHLVGIDFVAGGTDPDRDGGVDCYGAARLALRLYGVELPETPAEALASAEALAREIPAGEPLRPGDLIEVPSQTDIHIAVILSQFEVFEATPACGTVITRLDRYERAGTIRRRLRFRAIEP